MKRNVIIGLVIGVLVIAAAGVGYSAWQVKQRGDEQDRKAEVVTTTRAVDDKLAEVWDKLGERDQAWARQVNDPSGDLSTMIGTSESDVEKLRAQVDEVRELVEAIPSDDVQDAYFAVCDELEVSFEDSLEEAEVAKPLCDAYKIMLEADTNNETGWVLLNESITSCNNRVYADGKGNAENAKAQFQAARDLFAQASAVCAVSEVNDAIQFFDAELQLAALQYELASIGARGGINSYNAQIKKLNEQEKTVDSLRHLPGVAESAVWAEAETSYGHFKSRAAKAENLWEDARDLVSAGEV